MKKLILACSLLLAATGAQAQGTGSNSHPVQAYTTLGPAGAAGWSAASPHQAARCADAPTDHQIP
jgi:hypothetical protein